MEQKKNFQDLVEMMKRLRSPEGCPWDREQNFASLGPMLIEEAYEVIDAAEAENWGELRDELGDLLFQIVFYCQLGSEHGHFDVYQSIARVHEKMTRRHPHVFGNEKVENVAEVLSNWEAIKAKERAAEEPRESGRAGEERKASLLDGTSRKLPALLEVYQLTTKAARVGFDWKEGADIFTKLEEEVRELTEEVDREERDQAAVAAEIGDLLFVVCNIARWYGVEPESALKGANRKFRRRFGHIEKRLQEQGIAWADTSLAQMDEYWDEAKQIEQKDKGEKETRI
ncbi:MAG: nucleoside triphosphate pyrophosphohydrolase [Blastocatellia bacterium]|nr:nucleoside triphosphate pyrophosphohydrolase [Blastocatellia bacterium]